MPRRILLALLALTLPFALLLAGGCSSSQAPAPAAHWHVQGGFLRDPQGRAVILRGANVAGANKLPPYFGFQQPPDYQHMHDAWGMNCMRFLLSWAAIEPQEGSYDESYLDEVATRIGWAEQADIYVVLDMHQDVYGEGFASGGGDGAPLWTCDASHYAAFTPQMPWFLNDLNGDVVACYDHFWSTPELAQHYAAAWQHVAKRLASFDHVLGFDAMNEPYWGSTAIVGFEASVLQPFYEQIVPAVRAEAPSLIAFLEPASSRNLGLATRLTTFPFPDVVYAPHSYDRNAESGMGFDPSNASALEANLAAMAGEAKGLGAGLWIGEYGTPSNAMNATEYMSATYDGMGAVAAGGTYWSYDEDDAGYGLLNADGSEKTALLDAVVRPYPERIAGDPQAYAFDASTRTFTFNYSPDPKITAPTVLVVPDRVYPQGFTVECGGCAHTQAAGRVTLTTPPPGSPAMVVVHP